jgi:hypothetical protein
VASRVDAHDGVARVNDKGNGQNARPEARRRLHKRAVLTVGDRAVPVSPSPWMRGRPGRERPERMDGGHGQLAVHDPHLHAGVAGETESDRRRVEPAVCIRGKGGWRDLEVAELRSTTTPWLFRAC